MVASRQTVRDVLAIILHYVGASEVRQLLTELSRVRGNESFRQTVFALQREYEMDQAGLVRREPLHYGDGDGEALCRASGPAFASEMEDVTCAACLKVVEERLERLLPKAGRRPRDTAE